MGDAIGERDAALLLDILLGARDAADFLVGMDEAAFMVSRLHQNAVIGSLEVIGEAAGKVSAAVRQAHPDIPWRDMVGMRHRLIHRYDNVRLDVVWRVAAGQLGALIAAIAPLFPAEGGPEP